MNQNISWEQLARYFAAELNEEETKHVKTWIKANPEQAHVLYKIWKESGTLSFQLNVDEAWEALARNLDHVKEKKPVKINQSVFGIKRQLEIVSLHKSNKSFKKTSSIGRHIALVAASVLIMLMTGILTRGYYIKTQEAKTVANLNLGSEELTTRDGEKAIYRLKDGSRIILHSGSRIEVPINFNKDNRELYLEGEAYFDVTHNPDKPFIVHSDIASTRVLGTKFLFTAWPGKSKSVEIVEVIVEEGEVALGGNQRLNSNRRQEVIIKHNQKGILTLESGLKVTEVTDIDLQLGWTKGRFVFEDKQLSEILPRLERWYAVEIKINTKDKAIAEMKLTAEIDYSQPMMEVLNGIALSLELAIEKKDRVITFRMPDEQDE